MSKIASHWKRSRGNSMGYVIIARANTCWTKTKCKEALNEKCAGKGEKKNVRSLVRKSRGVMQPYYAGLL